MRFKRDISLLLAIFGALVVCPLSVGQVLKPLNLDGAKKGQGEKKKKQLNVDSILNRATSKYDKNATFLLKYKFKKGTILRWKVEHQVSTDTKVEKQTEKSASRSLSTMQWRVTNIDSLGHFTVEMSVLDADMWQQIDERPAITFNSKTHRGRVPVQFERFSEGIGVPIATYKISEQGQIQDKKETYKEIKFGVGNITMPVPSEPVKINTAWNAPGFIAVSRPNGSILRVKTRIQYRLQAVENGIASVSFNTHVLTPVDDPELRSQLIQQLSNGVIRFDLEKGLMISKELVWKESVVGFKGPKSNLDYVGKYFINLDQKVLSISNLPDQGLNKEGLQKFIRLSEDAPIFRW